MTIVAVYIWGNLIGSGIPGLFSQAIGEVSVFLAAAAAFVSFGLYMWVPKNRLIWFSLAAYGLLAVTAGSLVLGSGGVDSPFIFVWMLVAIFAGVFGNAALIPMALAVIGYLILSYTQTNSLTSSAVLATVFSGFLPLAVSYIIWHRQGEHESRTDRAYRDLANELSQVSGKSDVVISAIGDGVLALDRSGTIELINPAAQRLIGWQRQDALKLSYKSVLKLVDKNDKELSEASDPIAQVLSKNKVIKSDNLKLVTESGKKILVSIVVSPVGAQGDGVIIVFHDITKEKIEERQQAEFVSTASHEMRTPVAAIEGYLGLALNPAITSIDEKARDYITKAHESAQHLGRLFQDLLDVSKAEDGRLANNPKVVNVVEYLEGVVEGLNTKATEKGLRLMYKPNPDRAERPVQNRSLGMRSVTNLDRTINPVFFAHVDNDHLREVVANLVENAIKYTPAGDIVVDVTGDDQKIIISVQDSGIGIPAEDIPHLFQKFYRVDNTETREIGGTGLGLYLCRRLAEAMAGRLSVKSEYRQGSTFYLEIPRISHEDAMRLIDSSSYVEESTAKPVNPATSPEPLPPQSPQPQPIQPQAPVAPAPTTASTSAYTQVNSSGYMAPIGANTVGQALNPNPAPYAPAPTLSAIEQNPAAYTNRPPQSQSINIPSRSPGPTNQA